MIHENIIDYNFVKSFDIKKLKEALVVPLKTETIYFKCFVCKSSDVSLICDENLIKSYEISKEEILFFLSDINLRLELSNLLLKANLSDEINHKYLEEFVNNIVSKAIFLRSSDIHIEALENSIVIRFRIDGILKIFYVFKKEFFSAISSYLKLLSKLDITQSRLPQDGRFHKEVKKSKYDFRISTMPTLLGESIVIRILDSKNMKNNLNSLKFSSHVQNELDNIVKLTSGLVLITGPTGSGKSTTLYTLLNKLNNENKKIITVEDPIEYKLEQVQQINVNEEIGLGFNTILKNILRQDPDIILIGEIRDKYSLDIALQASLTGHLVLASIHANNSVETLTRLFDLKADKYLLSTSLKSIISQRLVLNICQKCKQKGCDLCNYSGFYGRSSISEILKIDLEISRIISKENHLQNIKEYLKKVGFISMLDDGKNSVKNGITTIEEVYRVLNS